MKGKPRFLLRSWFNEIHSEKHRDRHGKTSLRLRTNSSSLVSDGPYLGQLAFTSRLQAKTLQVRKAYLRQGLR